MLWHWVTESIDETASQMRIVQRGETRMRLMWECLAILRDRQQRLHYASCGAHVAEQLREQPVDAPEVTRCLRATRAGRKGQSCVSYIRLENGSLSDDPHDITTAFRDFFLSPHCSNPAVFAPYFVVQVRIFLWGLCVMS